VFDFQGNEWFEVDYLAQDWVFVPETNTNDDSDTVPYVMKLQSAPYRFIVDRDISRDLHPGLRIGRWASFDDELVPNVAATPFRWPDAGPSTASRSIHRTS
jgi:hypothetical protein